jgi:DNA-binding transcriptional MerR regulator
MRMRDLEKASGVGRETIRFYIREGLLPEPDRASRNSASYSEDHVARLKAIKRLQEDRFLPLSVIKRLLDAEASETWLEPQAFPMLDAMLTARLDQDAPRVAASAVLEQIGGDQRALDENIANGMIAVAADGTMTARDAAILRAQAELRDIGFSDELGFEGNAMAMYVKFIDWLTTQELNLFFEHTAGQVGEAQALAMAERGIAAVNEILTLLRTRTILKKLAERRRVANDNS